MTPKKWVIITLIMVANVIVFTQRETIKNRWVQGDEVLFSVQKKDDKNALRIYIVGSEGTIQAKFIERISKKCANVDIITKVNRFTNFAWQERNELHRFIREGAFDVVLIETSPVDFLSVNADRIARFESSAKKSNSRIFYWSVEPPQKHPDNFLASLPNGLGDLCLVPSPI